MNKARLFALAVLGAALSLTGIRFAPTTRPSAEAREATMARRPEGARAARRIETRDPAITLERARLAIYDGDYDGAVALLSRAALSHSNAAAELLGIAAACARARPAQSPRVDAEQGVIIRIQDESDRALAPFLVDVAVARAKRSLAISGSSCRARCASSSCATCSRSRP